MNPVATWFVSGGFGALLSGGLVAYTARGKNRADAAKAISEAAGGLVERMQVSSDKLEARVCRCETALDALIDAVEVQVEALESGTDPRLSATRLKADLRVARGAV